MENFKKFFNQFWGLILILIKVGGKGIPIFLKLIKGLKFGKYGLAAASVASYTYLFTWQFALVIVSMIFLHECGHYFAMKAYGIKTRGIYLIPFVGGAAVGDIMGIDYHKESMIALAGPFVGLLYSLVFVALFYMFETPIFAAIAMWGCLMNVFNLFPVNPLDGGRIVKSITCSIHRISGLIIMCLTFGLAIYLSYRLGIGLLAFIAFIGMLEILGDYLEGRRINKDILKIKVVLEGALIKLETTPSIMSDPINGHKRFEDYKKDLTEHADKRIAIIKGKRRTQMTKVEILKSSVLYLTLISVLLGIMLKMREFEGTKMAMDILAG